MFVFSSVSWSTFLREQYPWTHVACSHMVQETQGVPLTAASSPSVTQALDHLAASCSFHSSTLKKGLRALAGGLVLNLLSLPPPLLLRSVSHAQFQSRWCSDSAKPDYSEKSHPDWSYSQLTSSQTDTMQIVTALFTLLTLLLIWNSPVSEAKSLQPDQLRGDRHSSAQGRWRTQDKQGRCTAPARWELEVTSFHSLGNLSSCYVSDPEEEHLQWCHFWTERTRRDRPSCGNVGRTLPLTVEKTKSKVCVVISQLQIFWFQDVILWDLSSLLPPLSSLLSPPPSFQDSLKWVDVY